MRKGFTMIELIFVIVIIGILAAVALPRLTNTAEDAKKALVEDWVGTLNRTTGPGLWAHAIRNNKGSVKTVTVAKLKENVDVPDGIGNINFANCQDSNASLVTTKVFATYNGKNIYCKDGNTTSSPRFGFDVSTTDINSTVFPD